MLDMNDRKLIDAHTHFHIQGILSSDISPSLSICPKDPNNPYLTLLSEFPVLNKVFSPDTPVKHDITHHIETTEDRFKAAKREYDHMLQLGIIRPSSSACLHMVPKGLPVTGGPVVTTGPVVISTRKQYHTITLSHIFMIPPLFSLSWVSFVSTTRLQCPPPPKMFPRLRLQLHFSIWTV